jgi:D-alanyl-D-alanine carboxypeptidase
MATLQSDYAARIEELLHELGIPNDYARQRHLALCSEATDLISVGSSPEGNDCRLILPAAQSWNTMLAAARGLNIELQPLSGFRSVERQTRIIRGKLDLGETISDILRSIAAPGYSEHHTGRAIDIGSPEVLPLEEAFAHTCAYAWLIRHADEFGFSLSFPKHNPHGIVYEPWHWCWHG